MNRQRIRSFIQCSETIHLSMGYTRALLQHFLKLCTWMTLSLCTDQLPGECPAKIIQYRILQSFSKTIFTKLIFLP